MRSLPAKRSTPRTSSRVASCVGKSRRSLAVWLCTRRAAGPGDSHRSQAPGAPACGEAQPSSSAAQQPSRRPRWARIL